MIPSQAMTVTVNAVLASLFLPSVVLLDHGFHPRGISGFPVVEGLNAPNTLSRQRIRIGTLAHFHETMSQSTQPSLAAGHSLNTFHAMEQQDKRTCRTRLFANKKDEEEDGVGSNEISNENGSLDDGVTTGPMDLSIETDGATTTKIELQNVSLLSDFLYGANFVHSQYLSILWRYSIVKTFAVTLPIGIALWMYQEYGLYNALFRLLRSILAVSSAAARLLQLPLEFAQVLVLNIWNTSPEALAKALGILPNVLMIPMVQLLLVVRSAVMVVVGACCDNNAITFLSSMTAILVWRPAVEEWQYRSFLDKLLFWLPRWTMARWRELYPFLVAAMERIASLGANLTAAIEIPKLGTILSTGPSSTAPVEPEENLEFSSPPPVTDAKDFNATSLAMDLANEEANEESTYTPFLPNESTRILLGSLLFATTRLGWLSIDPADSVALSNSPYGFTIGFLQSMGVLISTGGGGIPGVRPRLRTFILFLAIHQTISTFLVAQHVFAGIYKRRGLAASVGAHVAWTIGKGTIPFRLAWKFWRSTVAGVWRTSSYGSSSSSSGDKAGTMSIRQLLKNKNSGGGEEDSNPSGDEGEDEEQPSRL